MAEFKKLIIFFITLVNFDYIWAIDDLQFNLEMLKNPQLRWDDITNKEPYWLSSYLNYLEDNQEVIIRLNSNSALRIHASSPITPNMFETEISSGNGVFFKTSLIKTNNDHDLIIAPLPYAYVVKIRSTTRHDNIRFYGARYESIPKFISYNESIASRNSPTKRLLKTNETTIKDVNFQAYNYLAANTTATFKIHGPVRLELLANYIYKPSDSGEDFIYELNLSLDGKSLGKDLLIAQADYYNMSAGDTLISKNDYVYVDIEHGSHILDVTSPIAIYAQVHKLDHQTYNKKQGKHPSVIKNEAIALARDNTYQASGLKAVGYVNDMWQERLDDTDLKETTLALKNSFVYFKSLIPSNKNKLHKLSMDWAANYNLNNVDDEGKVIKVAQSQVDHLLSTLEQANFVLVEEGLDYILPKRGCDSELKIIVAKEHLIRDSDIYIQFDNGKKQNLKVYADLDSDSYSYAPSLGLIGLSILEPEHSLLNFSTLGSGFTRYYQPGLLRSSGAVKIPLPKDIGKIKLWSNNQKLEVALQYSASKKYTLPLSLNLSEAELISPDIKAAELFKQGLEFFATNQGNANPEDFKKHIIQSGFKIKKINEIRVEALYNNWLDTIRFLYSRHQKFVANVSRAEEEFIGPIGKENLSVNIHDNQKADASKRVIAWNEIIVKTNDLDLWRQAHLERALALEDAGESFLAERALKALFVHARDVKTKNKAYVQLLDSYKKRQYYFGIEGLIATYLMYVEQNETILNDLSDVLLEDDNSLKAIEIAALNNRWNDKVTYALARMHSNSALLNNEMRSKQENNFWQGQNLQIIGKYKQALSKFAEAGIDGAVWGDYLTQGLVIRKKLTQDNSSTNIDRWQDWHFKHPGYKIWQPANYLIENYNEAALIQSITRDDYANSFIIGDKELIKARATGPANMQLRWRPILKDLKNVLAIKSWIKLTIDGREQFFKIKNHQNEGTLKIIGHEDYIVGDEQLEQFTLPKGEHEILVEGQNQEALAFLYIQEPLLALSVLPAINPKSLNYLSNFRPNNNQTRAAINYQLVNDVSNNSRVSKQSFAADSFYLNNNLISLPQTSTLENQLFSNDFAQINTILFEYEQNLSKNLLIKGENLCFKNRGDYSIDQICDYFQVLSRWNRILSLGDDYPTILLDNREAWQPDSDNLSIRKALIDEENKDDLVLSDTSVTIIDFVNESKTDIKIKASLLKLIAANEGKAVIGVQIDDEPVIKLPALSFANNLEQVIQIDKGKHSLRISLVSPEQETFVKLNITEFKKDNWQKVEAVNKKEYFITTKNKPILYKVKAPSWTQVHLLAPSGILEEENYFVLSGEQLITIKPKGDRSFVRIFEKIPAKPKVANLQSEPDIKYILIDDSTAKSPPLKTPSNYVLQDDLPLEGQNYGTLSLGTSINKIVATDVVNNRTLERLSDRYLEEILSFRYYDDLNRLYFHSDFLTRQHQNNSMSYGLKLRANYVPMTLPFNLYVNFSNFGQKYAGSFNNSTSIEAGLRNELALSRQFYQVIELSAFARRINNLSLNSLSKHHIDKDVFNYYDYVHYKGLNASYGINYEFLPETRLNLTLGGRSNVKFDKADHLSIKGGLLQYFMPVTFGAGYEFKRYFKGDKRLLDFNTYRFTGLINYQQWFGNQNHRFELTLKLSHVTNLLKKTIGPKHYLEGSLGATFHLGNGRDLSDFRSDEISFRKMRPKTIPSKNMMK